MSGGGSGNTQTVQQSVPPYLQNQHQQNLTDANNVTGMEYQPYTGPRIAGWTDDQTNAFNMLRGSLGTWQPAVNTATTAASGIASGQQAVPQVRPASQQFNAQSYLSANPDVAAWAKEQAVATGKSLDQLANEHWNTFGMAENRSGAMQAIQAPQMQAAQMDRGNIRDVSAQKFTDADLNSYMNPYTQSVIDTTLNTLSRQNDVLQNQANARAAAAGAFGGSRQAVMNAENNRNYLDQAATTTAQLNDRNFTQAQSAIAGDQNRALQAGMANQNMDWNVTNGNANLQQQANATNAGLQWDATALNANQGMQAALANQSAGLQGAGQQLTAAQLLAALGGQGQQYSRNDANALLGIGGTQQAYNQSNLDLAYNDFLNQRNYLSQQLAARNNYLNPGMSMGGTSSTTMPGASWLQAGIGSLAGLGGAYSMLTGNPIFGTGGLLGGLGSSAAGTITAPILDSTASGLGSMIA
ncbi:hypothetical protein E6C67_26795 [Azospirillum sp. TSA2s]|uniref:hypothetical protein n=1 Tax=Azospirillum sp. TSA2s TaxID=709810 RepID=UPI0010AB127F|nr:hypothetical protein [Azospirillum sp. TSA2s]QCG97383.1 hypothetical protein E6C67_26795 [Azospirillum sp. TSA2s]